MSADLTYAWHQIRNAQEDYDYLRECGVSHDEAVKRVGYTLKSWEDAHLAAGKRAKRGES